MKLRAYQSQAIECVESVFARGGRSTLLVACTGAGKTIISAKLIEDRYKRKKKCVFLAHREELLGQTLDKLKQVNKAIKGSITQGAAMSSRADDVMVASVQTLANDPAKLRIFADRDELELCITDECHHATASTYRAIYKFLSENYPNCKLLGVTATPKRPDGESLSDVFEELAYQINLYDLIDQGFLTPIKGITIKSTVSLKNVKVTKDAVGYADFSEQELSLTVNCPVRNKLVVDTYRVHGIHPEREVYMRTIIFCVNVNHARNLATTINESGLLDGNGKPIKAAAIYGDLKAEERRKILRDFASGKLHVLTNVNVLTEGFDDPTVECVIVARPTLSTVLYPQMVGRGVRLNAADPEKVCYVIDIVDKDNRGAMGVSGLLDIPVILPMKGENIIRKNRELKEHLKQHPLIGWKKGEDLTRDQFMSLLAPSTIFEVAKTVRPYNISGYLWFSIGSGGKWGISLPDGNWATLIANPDTRGSYDLTCESKLVQTYRCNTIEEALEQAADYLKASCKYTGYEMYYPGEYTFNQRPTKEQARLLHNKYRMSIKELRHLPSKGVASLLIARLSISQRLCSLDNRFPSGKYFSFSIPVIYFFDLEYIQNFCGGHAAVTYFLENKANILNWYRHTKPIFWENSVLTKFNNKELQEFCKLPHTEFRAKLLPCMEEDIEYNILQLKAQKDE